MNVLFEEFVFEVMRRKCSGISVSAQKGKKLLIGVESNHKKRNTFVDILVEKGNEKIIVDTKYKKFETPSDFSNPDVFQISTYCLLHDTKKAILIYPQWNKNYIPKQISYLNTPAKDYVIQFSTVNLQKDLKTSNIEEELNDIIDVQCP
jgi:5-methylcytosine-specific restriction endonuclease McrBC regulatory subunit McrC